MSKTSVSKIIDSVTEGTDDMYFYIARRIPESNNYEAYKIKASVLKEFIKS